MAFTTIKRIRMGTTCVRYVRFIFVAAGVELATADIGLILLLPPPLTPPLFGQRSRQILPWASPPVVSAQDITGAEYEWAGRMLLVIRPLLNYRSLAEATNYKRSNYARKAP